MQALLARFLRTQTTITEFRMRLREAALIVFSLEIVAPDGVRTALLRTLCSILGPTRVAPGCRSARLFADLDARRRLVLVEEWESRAQFERNVDATKLNTLVGAIELSGEPPVVRIDTTEREEGVGLLAVHHPASKIQANIGGISREDVTSSSKANQGHNDG